MIATFSVGGFASMRHDIEIPARYGVRQTVGDSVGPGGISRALRSVPVILEVARAMERCCPEALLVNVSNPLTALCRAVDPGDLDPARSACAPRSWASSSC